LSAAAERLASGLAKAFADAGVAAHVPRVASLVGVFFGDDVPVDFDSARRTDEVRYARWFHGMLERGVALAPGAYEVMFPGTTHSDAIIDAVVSEAQTVAANLASG